MKNLIVKTIIICGLILNIQSISTAETLRIAIFQLEPFMMEDPETGEITGITVRYWKEYIAPRLGVDLEFIGQFPITRAVAFLQNGTADVIPQITKIAERERIFLYPQSRLTSIISCLIVPRASSLETVESARDLYGMKIGFMHDAYIPQLLIDGNITVELISNQDFRSINIRKLLAGRLDAVLDINYISMKEYLHISNLENDVKLILLPVEPEPVYSIFRKTPELEEYMILFDEINEKGREDGVFERMTREYFDRKSGAK